MQEFNEVNWKKKLEIEVAQYQEEVERSLKRIEELIKEMGSFNVIANISYLNSVQRTNEYSDYDRDGVSIVAEYVALLCLKQPFSMGKLELIEPMDFYSAIQEIQEYAMSIVFKISFIKTYTQIKDQVLDIESIEEIARSFEREEYYVRNPAFDIHHWEILEELFTSFNGEVKESLGFNVSDAIDLCYSIGNLITAKSEQNVKENFKNAERHFYELLRYKTSGIEPNDPYPDDLLIRLVKLTKKELKEYFMKGAELYSATKFGDYYSFTAEDLSKESEIDILIVENFLIALSIGFEEVSIDFSKPLAVHPLKQTPIIKGEDRYIVPSPPILDWSIDKLIENTLLNSSSKLSSRYKSTKHNYLINKTLSLIKEIIPGCMTYSECEYFFLDRNGETDGIVLWDDCLFVIEAKSHKITDSAKKGSVKRVEKHLDDIFNKAYEQGIRTLNYIDSRESVTFKSKSKEKIEIKSENYPHKFLIINSFAQLGHIVPLIKKTNKLEMFKGDNYPYVVSVYDLLVLKDILDFPSLFPYYIQRRTKFLEAKKFRVTDEVDVLGNFLEYGLYFEHLDPENKMDGIFLPQFTDEFNRYYFFKEGLTTKRYKKPSYKIDSKIKHFINILEKSSVRHRSTATLILLDLPPQIQQEFIRKMAHTKKSVRKDGKQHDFSYFGKHEGVKWGLTYMAYPDKKVLSKRLNEYCRYKAMQEQASKWIGIADCGTKKHEIMEIVIISNC